MQSPPTIVAKVTIPDDENDPPPCYEQALRMYGLISIESDLEDQHQQGNNEDTRL